MRESTGEDNEDAERLMEELGMFDHQGLRRFAKDFSHTAGSEAAALCAGFFFGLAWSARHADD